MNREEFVKKEGSEKRTDLRLQFERESESFWSVSAMPTIGYVRWLEDKLIVKQPLPPAEGAESAEAFIKRKHPQDWDEIPQWHIDELNEFAAQQQPTAEGAEEFLLAQRNGDGRPITFALGKDGWAYKMIIHAMQEFATLHAQRIADKMVEKNWININDRMPESGFCVLLYSESGGVAEGAWSDSNGYFEQWRWSAILSDVTHWMPLPNPPIE